ncbi:MAG TPA: ATP-binding protein [Pirellulales bacterium]|jgi:hypothetical protein|nr:ATP-binding protein [Pirellulales bacterium]
MITQRERAAIIQSLGAGVVPAIGLQHIQVGRRDEVAALVKDLEVVEAGASAVRFVIGRYGSGKTFFLNLIRNVALTRKFCVVQADITTERRLQGTGGTARALFSEFMANLATRGRPEGGALPSLIERWIGEIDHAVRSAGGTDDDVTRQITDALRPLQDLVSGFDFANVLTRYYDGYRTHNQGLQDAAMRWLRGEYATKTEARQDLGVRSIIDDDDVYDYLKLFAAFARIAGHAGLVVNIDELVVLSHRLTNTLARNKNYEAILRILNDCLQGSTKGLLFVFAGTDECLEDRRRGLYSYEALATRLAPNRFAVDGRKDYSSPVIRLESLTPEDCYVLLVNIRKVFAMEAPAKFLIPDEGIAEYLMNCNSRMGAAYFQTPRDTVKDFIGLLKVLEQDASLDWHALVDSCAGAARPSSATATANPKTAKPAAERLPSVADDDLSQLKL